MGLCPGFVAEVSDKDRDTSLMAAGDMCGGPMLQQRVPFRNLFFAVARINSHSRELPPVPCAHRPPCCLFISVLICNGMVSHAAPNQSPKVHLFVRQSSHSCEWLCTPRVKTVLRQLFLAQLRLLIALRIDFINVKHEENARSQRNKGVILARE